MSGIFLWSSGLVVAGAFATGLGVVGEAAMDDARAQTAADAAALAGAAAGHGVAAEVAAINDALLVSVSTESETTTVVVRFGRVTATARAKRILIPIV